MKKYETPKLNSIYFDVEKKIMDGYNEGDIDPEGNPWGDLFTEQASQQ